MTATASIAKLLRQECSELLKLYRKSFLLGITVTDSQMNVTPSLDPKEKLWQIHSALDHCHKLMDIAISTEKDELGTAVMGNYETQRDKVKYRLGILVTKTKELLKSTEGSAVFKPVDRKVGTQGGAQHVFDVDAGVHGENPPKHGENMPTPLRKVEVPTTAYKIKLWVYSIYKEVYDWAGMTVNTLQAPFPDECKMRGRNV